MAALFGHRAVVSYLFEVTSLDVIQQEKRLDLFKATIKNEMYGKIIHHIWAIKNLFIQIIGTDGNNILHLAGKLGQPILKQKNKLFQYVPPDADNNVVLQQLFQEIRQFVKVFPLSL